MSEEFYPPPNAVGAHAIAIKAGIPVSEAVDYLESCGYEHLGMWSDGDDYYAPTPGRLPVLIRADPDRIIFTSPTSFDVFPVERPGDQAALKAFLDEENAYVPLAKKEKV